MTPLLETARLRLLPFADSHANERYLAWLSDPAVVRFSELRHRPQTLESCRSYRSALAKAGHIFWAIETREGLHIGNITAILDRNNSVADLSILVGERSVWGCGYGSEAWIAACRYLISTGEMRKVRAGTMSANVPMRALMRKAGMTPDGVWRRHLLLDGVETDVEFAALFRQAQ